MRYTLITFAVLSMLGGITAAVAGGGEGMIYLVTGIITAVWWMALERVIYLLEQIVEGIEKVHSMTKQGVKVLLGPKRET